MAARKFIGGIIDGELKEIEEHLHFVEIPWIENRKIEPLEDIRNLSPYGGRIRRDLYRERLIRGGKTTFYVFVLDGISDDEMMEKLIMGYRGPR